MIANMHRWKLSALAAAAFVSVALASPDAAALTLGRIQVQSGLGENLRAEIDIPQITPEEMNSLVAQIASPDTFRAQGVDYSEAAQAIQVELHRNADGTAVLRLSSNTPIQQPFVDFLLETQWNAGHLVRSYSLLLNAPQAKPDSAAAPATPSINRPRIAPAPAAATGRTYRSDGATAASRPAATTAAGDVRVRSGDTAGRIALSRLPAGVSLDQMLIAMLQSNPQAFVNGNVNRLRAGAVLKMPSREDALATSRTEARQMVAAQSRNFNAYRRSLASKAPRAQVQAAGRSAQGQVQAQVQETQAAPASPDKLTLSKGAMQSAAAEAALAAEKQAQDQDSRLSELQRNLAELNELAQSSPSTSASETPAAVSASDDATTPASPAPAANPADTASGIAVASSTLSAVDGAATSAAPVTAPATTDAPASPSADGTATAPAEASAEASNADTASGPEAPAAAVQPSETAPASEAAAPEASARPATSEDTKSSPWLPVGGGLLALILAVIGHSIWKRRKSADGTADGGVPATDDPVFAEALLAQNQAAASAGTDGEAIAPVTLNASDPLEEADDLMAFGRDVQAEAVLEKALGQQPKNLDIHLKLAEIYVKRQDVDALEQAARAIHDISQGQGPAWERVLDMGLALQPDHPYFSAMRTAPVDAAPLGAAGGMAAAAGRVAAAAAPSDVSADNAQTAATDTDKPDDNGPDIDALLDSMATASAAPQEASTETEVPSSLDLDIAGFEVPAADATPAATSEASEVDADVEPEEDLVDEAAATPAEPAAPEVDLGSLDLDLGPDAAPAASAQPVAAAADPLATKLDLAQEFNSIGDSEGARALIEEVLAEASGEIKQRAQDLLSKLD
ncbi:MAG: FimV/HubP family polar landmark protein [Comamonas sp.]